uniref:lysozyme n=1 Tax=Heliothis virescens TaxID=7102 RepID=A0A2A4JD13_HELVI
MTRGCSDGYCGPFIISRVYWVDAGKPTLPDDDPERKEAFEDCAKDYHCSIKIIESYMANYGKDCNHDGVTDCFDYMMINYHGGRACSKPLLLTQSGRRWLKSYLESFEDCAKDYHCSIKIIESYMANYGKDCNHDGVTDCFDYMMINYHGGRACSKPLLLTQSGRRWLKSYLECRF